MFKFNVDSLKHLCVFVAFVIVSCTVGMIVSIQAPFFPAEAMKKNLTATEYGLVFTCAEISQIIGLPIIGTYVTKIGTMNAFTGGILTAASTTILFGFVNRLNGHVWFISVSLVLRLINTFSTGILFVATLVLVNISIPGANARHLNVGECLFSIGFSIGPVFGGILFDLGGFTIPFVTLGCIQLAGALITGYIFAKTANSNSSEKSEELLEDSTKNYNNEFGYKRLFKIPSAIVYNFCVTVSVFNIVFVQTLLDAHLKRFDLSAVQIGSVFLANGMVNAMGFVLFGVICERIRRADFIAIFGILSVTASALIIGPDPFIPFSPKLWIIVVGLALSGFGRAAIFAAGNVILLKDVLRNGFSEDDATSGLLAGLFLESIEIGALLGPITAGILFDHFGFRKATTLLTVLNVITSLVLILFICSNHQKAHIELNKIVTTDADSKLPLLPPKTEKPSYLTKTQLKY